MSRGAAVEEVRQDTVRAEGRADGDDGYGLVEQRAEPLEATHACSSGLNYDGPPCYV